MFAPTIVQHDGMIYYLRPGTSKKVLIAELREKGIIHHSFVFSLYIAIQPKAQLKTGEYRFPQNATPISIWKQITTGTGLFYRPFAIIPGWSFNQLRNELSQQEALHHITQNLSDQAVMNQLGYPNLSAEGEFFPETYYYTRDVPDVVILKKAFDLMQNKLEEAWEKRDPNLPFKDAYDALIAASLVEKETSLNFERPIIAGVLVNRLKRNMLLQFDPTVIYGLGSRYDGKIHKANLLDDNLYNTYIHKGLPPTPIAMPSLTAIEAVLHPQKHDYFYFVAKGDGSHYFSKTLVEHNAVINSTFKHHGSYFNKKLIRYYLMKHNNTR